MGGGGGGGLFFLLFFQFFFFQAAVSVKISNLLVCFCSFDLSCPTLEKSKL